MGFGILRHPPIAIIDIVSAPPAIIISANPARIFAVAIAIDSNPDAQYLFTVEPGTSIVSKLIKEIILPIFKPLSASGNAFPVTTSSILFFSICGKSFIRCLITATAISSGRVNLNLPLGALPIADLYPPTIYASIFFNLVVSS